MTWPGPASRSKLVADVRHDRPVARGANMQRDVAGALDVDGLVAGFKSLGPVGRQILIGIGGIDGLDEQILGVGLRRGDAPGDRRVVAEHEQRQAGDGGADDRTFRGVYTRQIPHDRRLDLEVGVVGEDRLARGRARAGDHPLVGGGVREREPVSEFSLGIVEPGVVGMRLGRRRHRRIVGQARHQPRRLLGRQFMRQSGARDFLSVVAAEIPRHQLDPHHRIGGLPRLRVGAEQHEFDRERVVVRIDEGVDPVGIGLQPRLGLGRQRRNARLGEPI